MVGAVVDAADEGCFAIHHHDLAVQAAEQVGAHAHQLGARIKGLQPYPGLDHFMQELPAQVSGAVTVHQHFHAHATLGRGNQRLLQRPAHLILEQNEGLDQHFLARRLDGLEHAVIERLAVDQQLHGVVTAPQAVHRRTSTASGTWSDKCDHGLRASTLGVTAVALRRYTRSRHSIGRRAGKVRATAP